MAQRGSAQRGSANWTLSLGRFNHKYYIVNALALLAYLPVRLMLYPDGGTLQSDFLSSLRVVSSQCFCLFRTTRGLALSAVCRSSKFS
jgi:hypothetical protein